MSKRTDFNHLASLLHNWIKLNERIMHLSEGEVGSLLSYEKKHRNRITFIMRLHSRLNKLRRERERSVLAHGAGINVVMIPGVVYRRGK